MKPRWVIVENVNRMKSWDRHDDLLVSLKRLGYQVNDLFLNAADFGTPQSRKRLFLVCDLLGSVISKEDLLAIHRRAKRTLVQLSTGMVTTKQPRYVRRAAPNPLLRVPSAQ